LTSSIFTVYAGAIANFQLSHFYAETNKAVAVSGLGATMNGIGLTESSLTGEPAASSLNWIAHKRIGYGGSTSDITIDT
jgi:hypothetical protein